MTLASHCLREAASSVRREARRLIPMALGIVWGMTSVVVLLGIANGFEASQRRALQGYGERFIVLRLNRAELDRAGGGEERRLQMDAMDVDRLRQGAPAIRRLSPMNMFHRARITGRSGAGSNVVIAGVLPEITRMRNLQVEDEGGGRFFDELDEAERRRVIVLGPLVRKQLFGKRPAVGQTVRIAGFSSSPFVTPTPAVSSSTGARASASTGARGASGTRTDAPRSRNPVPPPSSPAAATPKAAAPTQSTSPTGAGAVSRDFTMEGELFTVVGVLKDVETQHESYASVARLAFVPFSTSCAVFDRDFSTMVIEPRSLEDRDRALEQFRQVMGARYGFELADRNAVVVYFDALERARAIGAVFGGVRLFLAAVGALILAIGAIGVMNVVLVSVAARTFEIGLRKALGATPLVIYLQFFTETVLVCFLSGGLGFLLGTGGILLLSGLPLPEGFSRPLLDGRAVAMGFGLLSAVAILVGIYPARRAARLTPIGALRARG